MSSWAEVRRIARHRHDELANGVESLVSSEVLLASAQEATGIKVVGRPAGDALLDGAEAAYDRDRKRIYFSRETPAAVSRFHIAHEFAHHWLDQFGAACSNADLELFVPSEPEISPVGDQDSYSPKERAEAQANLFAREFLLPRHKLSQRCADGIPDAEGIAAEIALPVDLVMQQLADALLLPPERENEESIKKEAAPDKSQNEAITASDEPRQVRAGPGTGKTRTLVGRIAHLIKTRGEDPASIVALTYSNLAARDLASRIRVEIGEKATAVWSGTFHAYGLELLRKYRNALGFGSEPRLLDRTDTLMLLEELLPQLELNHYLDLREPMLKLRSLLGAISRAKDEFVSPDGYLNAALAMADDADDDESVLAADRAIEVARIFATYETAIRQRDCVDFGDLVVLPIKLLRENPEIRTDVQNEKRHVLVDEYQDMNRASGLLLKELCVEGRGPWVVGDVRQSIYRFRGASPLNMSRFADEFSGAKSTDLAVNYRSGGKIVRLFETFGKRMSVGASVSNLSLKAHRGDDEGTIKYDVATTREAEAQGIAQQILSRKKNGVSFSDHVVLARSHTILARLAKELEGAGVPCLYFGDFFERSEIRDLLSLLSLVSERKGVGLLRVAQFPAYRIPPADIQLIFQWRAQSNVSMLVAVRSVDQIQQLSDAGREGLRALVRDIQDVEWKLNPHRFLMSFLLRRSRYLQVLLADHSVSGQQQRLAIYQLLQFAFTYRAAKKEDPKRAFLSHVRRLEILDEEKQLRQLPAAAGDIDAVRLMTVHASKGLEFPCVHLISLTATQFPAPGRHEPCPLPPGLVSDDALMSRNAEEDSLFFVAVSRAKDTLHLSRAKTNGKRNTNPSRLLEAVESHLPQRLDVTPRWKSPGLPDPTWPQLVGKPPRDEWTAREIESFVDCPRRYYYDHSLELGGTDSASPFLKFQSALHASLSWLRNTSSIEERKSGLENQFKEDWNKFGPSDHPFEPLYRRMAEVMIQTAHRLMEGESLAVERSLELSKNGVKVSCRADHVERTPAGIVIRRLKAGRLAKSEEAKIRHALLRLAIQDDHPDESIFFEHVSLLDGERRSAPDKSLKVDEHIQSCLDAIDGAQEGRFDPKPSQSCPSCPYFFICPSHGAVR